MIHRASSPVTQFTHRKTCLRVIVVDCQPVEGAFWFVDLFLEMISQMMEFMRLFPWAFKVQTFYLWVWVWLRCPWPKIFPKHKNPLLAPKWLPPLACLHAWIAFAFPPLALLSLQTPLAFNFAYSVFYLLSGYPDHMVFSEFRRRFDVLAPHLTKKHGRHYIVTDEKRVSVGWDEADIWAWSAAACSFMPQTTEGAKFWRRRTHFAFH